MSPSDPRPPSAPAFHPTDTERVLAQRSVPAYLGGRVLSGLAMQMQAVVVGWQIYDLTHSTWDLGLVGLAQFLPMLMLTLLAGHAADRFDRRIVAGLCRTVSAVLTAALAWQSWRGTASAVSIYALVALLGASRAFMQPAQVALLPSLVAPAMLSRATALATATQQAAMVIGPALGGVLYVFGAATPYALAAAAQLASALLCIAIHPSHRPMQRGAAGLGTVFEGIRFIRSQPAILGAISLDLFAVLLGGATALLPVYARDILRAGPTALGLMRAGPAFGAVVVSFVLTRFRLRRHVGPVMFGAVVVFGMATAVFAVSRSVVLSIAMLVLLGGADVFSVVIRQTLVQLRTPDAMRGRVSAVNSLFIGTSNQLGEFESGLTASLVGTVPAVLLGGFGTVGVALLWMRLFPELRRMDRFEAE